MAFFNQFYFHPCVFHGEASLQRLRVQHLKPLTTLGAISIVSGRANIQVMQVMHELTIHCECGLLLKRQALLCVSPCVLCAMFQIDVLKNSYKCIVAIAAQEASIPPSHFGWCAASEHSHARRRLSLQPTALLDVQRQGLDRTEMGCDQPGNRVRALRAVTPMYFCGRRSAEILS